MVDIKKMILILILSIIAAPLHYLYNRNTVKVKRENGLSVVNYKGYEITTTEKLDKNIKVEKVKEMVEKLGVECEFIRIVD